MTDDDVYISESAVALITEMGDRAHPVETGGVLMGVRAGARLWITHAAELTTGDRGPASYRLPAKATRRTIRKYREQDVRLGYLGDWHSHPMDVGASGTDVRTSRATARSLGRNVLLLVARRRSGSYALDLLEATASEVMPRRIVLTGDLVTI
jgi:integrative and conjugative element protein (TIGR02256 family)